MVKRQRRMTKKKTIKKAAPKVKPAQKRQRSHVKKPSRVTAADRANKAQKVLMKALKENQEGSE